MKIKEASFKILWRRLVSRFPKFLGRAHVGPVAGQRDPGIDIVFVQPGKIQSTLSSGSARIHCALLELRAVEVVGTGG